LFYRKALLAVIAVITCLMVVGVGHAATRGLTVSVRASEAANAPKSGEVNLYSSSHALVIGNDNYTNGWPRLAQARNDAKDVASALEARSFDVTLVLNANSSRLEKALEDFFIDKGADPEARLFVWFAGHGHTTVKGEGYLIPTDGAMPSNRSGFLRTALSLRDFGKYVRLANAKHVFTIFDSCFAGTIFDVARSSPPPQITRVTAEPVRQFLSSGDAGQKVSDDGLFASLFIDALKGQRRADANGDTYLTASELGAFLDTRISNYTQNRQTPRFGTLRDPHFDRGDFVFQLASLTPPSSVSRNSAAQSVENLFWKSTEASGDAESYLAYLDQYPEGSFSSLASVRLKNLKVKRAEGQEKVHEETMPYYYDSPIGSVGIGKFEQFP
jgi:hypothetical protein